MAKKPLKEKKGKEKKQGWCNETHIIETVITGIKW